MTCLVVAQKLPLLVPVFEIKCCVWWHCVYGGDLCDLLRG